MKETIVAEEEQVGAVGPRHCVEDQLPRTFWHLRHIFGMQTTPLAERLQQTTCRFLAFNINNIKCNSVEHFKLFPEENIFSTSEQNH